MNKNLENLYNEKWEALKLEANKLNRSLAHPLLIKVPSEYEESDIKVMIVGQETDGWNEEFRNSSRTVEFLMNDYEAYLKNDSKYEHHYSGRLKKNKRPFWNKSNFKYFENELREIYFPKSVCFIWNNISKIGNFGPGKGKALIEIENLENLYFNVLKNEFYILNPDIVIFTTGPSRDNFIRKKLNGEIEKEAGSPIKKIAKVIFSENKLKNICSYRTYHPNYDTKNRFERNNKVLSLIKNNIILP